MDSIGFSTVTAAPTATDGTTPQPAASEPQAAPHPVSPASPDSSQPAAAGPAATEPTPAEYLARAVAIATENVRNAGGPFGAIVVTADGRVFEGVNRVTANLDPTAHAEVSAIRAACQGTGSFDLTGAALYTSCEPCPMCLASSLWARIDRVYFAATRHDAADAGFDDAVFYRYFEGDEADRAIMPVGDIELPPAERVAPFTEWQHTATRTEY